MNRHWSTRRVVLLIGLGLVVGVGASLVRHRSASSPLSGDASEAVEHREVVRFSNRRAERGAAGRSDIIVRPAPAHSRPGSDEYDPLTLSMLGSRAPDVFDSEPRSAVWAAEMEHRFLGQLQADLDVLFPDSTSRVECRTSACVIHVETPAADLDDVYQYVQAMPVGNVISPGAAREVDGRSSFSFHVLLGRDFRSPSDHLSWFLDVRARVIAQLADKQVFSPDEIERLRHVRIE